MNLALVCFFIGRILHCFNEIHFELHTFDFHLNFKECWWNVRIQPSCLQFYGGKFHKLWHFGKLWNVPPPRFCGRERSSIKVEAARLPPVLQRNVRRIHDKTKIKL